MIDGSRNERVLPEILTRFAPRVVFALLGGQEHNMVGLFESDEPLDFLTPIHNTVQPARRFVPFAQVRSTLEQRMQNALQNLTTMRTIYDGEMHVVLPPPPFAELDDQAVLPTVTTENASAIAPADIRHKLYYTACHVMKVHAQSLGVPLIEPPRECMDAHGFLLRSMWHEDPTHGCSSTFGALLLSKLKEVAAW